MAIAKIKKRLSRQIDQTEFYVKTKRVLAELLDPEEVTEDDRWEFVSSGSDGLIIVRYREVSTKFDSAADDEKTDAEQISEVAQPATIEPDLKQETQNDETSK